MTVINLHCIKVLTHLIEGGETITAKILTTKDMKTFSVTDLPARNVLQKVLISYTDTAGFIVFVWPSAYYRSTDGKFYFGCCY
jgi:hypothetical protein